MKRILVLIISLLITFTSALTCVSAETSPVIFVSTENGEPGKNVTVSVIISDNPGIAAYALKLHFDKSVLCPVSINGNGVTSNIQQENINKEQLDFVTAIWSSESDKTDNGTLFTVEFTIKNGYTGSTALTLSYDSGDICNQLLEDIMPQTVNGAISVAEKSTAAPTAKPDAFSIDCSGGRIDITSPYAGEYYVIAAAYMVEGLIGIEIVPVSFSEAGSETVSLDRLNTKGADIIKLMLWNNLDDMKPLCNAQIVDITDKRILE